MAEKAGSSSLPAVAELLDYLGGAIGMMTVANRD